MKRDFLTLCDLSIQEIESLLERALSFKKSHKIQPTLNGKTLIMVFEKESTRTRVSFEVAMQRLGGHAISMSANNSQISRGETYEDTARVLSRYGHGLMIRTFAHDTLKIMAQAASVPVINGLTDSWHPCQLLADLLTIKERGLKKWKDLKIAWVGDGNNMANSWMTAASLLGFQLDLACPKGFEPTHKIQKQFSSFKNIRILSNPKSALKDAQVINTDTWFSMGQKVSKAKTKAFAPFQLNKTLLQKAPQNAIVLHCLPAHRGEEITDEVMDGPQSVVWDQAENRLHAQMALLEFLLK